MPRPQQRGGGRQQQRSDRGERDVDHVKKTKDQIRKKVFSHNPKAIKDREKQIREGKLRRQFEFVKGQKKNQKELAVDKNSFYYKYFHGKEGEKNENEELDDRQARYANDEEEDQQDFEKITDDDDILSEDIDGDGTSELSVEYKTKAQPQQTQQTQTQSPKQKQSNNQQQQSNNQQQQQRGSNQPFQRNDDFDFEQHKQQKKEKIDKKKEKTVQMKKRTKKGQPIMKNEVLRLLEKIQK